MDQSTQLLINEIFKALPPLRDDPYFKILAEKSRKYNCIAWVYQVKDLWMWPEFEPSQEDPEVVPFWPVEGQYDDHINHFVEVFQHKGFQCCQSYLHETGFQKIALYTEIGSNSCSHAALESVNSSDEQTLWTSKLGRECLIQHSSPLELQGPFYGKIHCYMKKAIS